MRSSALITSLSLSTASLAALPSYAALVWTGASDGVSAFNEGNWLGHDGNAAPANTVNNNVAIPDNATLTNGEIEISAGTGTPSNYGGVFSIGTNNLTIANSKILGGGSFDGASSAFTGNGSTVTINSGGTLNTNSVSGMNSFVLDDGTIDLRGSAGITMMGTNATMSLGNGSSVASQFLSGGTNTLAVTLDGGSVLILRGAGNPLNGTTVDVLDTDSTIQFLAEVFDAGNGTGGFVNEHLGKVTLGGQALVFGSDPFAVEAGDNALATAIQAGNGVEISFVPEPGSIALLSLGGLLLGRRRRAL